MTKLLLSLHVLAAIVAVGPVTVAASMFPPAVRAVPAGGGADGLGTVRLLHRICRVYAGFGIAVPLLGFVTAQVMGVLGDTWLIVSVVLTAVAAGLLLLLVLPGQEELLERLAGGQSVERSGTVRLAMGTGLFNLAWATVTVLMIVRPGSTTGT
jgi:hypothetical protein